MKITTMKRMTVKMIMLIGISIISTLTIAQENENYIVIINGDSIQIDLDTTIQHKTSSGDELSIKVVQPKLLTYSDDMVSFKYDKAFSISDTKINEEVSQCMVMTSTGTGFLVQRYNTIDPSSLTELMLNEIIKESLNYGYTKKEKKFKKKLISGHTIEGIQATLTYKGTEQFYTVATYGDKDEGILVVTMELNPDFNEKKMIQTFLNTLKVK